MTKPDPDLSNRGRIDRAQALATQLDALLQATTGEAGEGFRTLSDLLQSNFMWACSDMARELMEHLNEISVARHD